MSTQQKSILAVLVAVLVSFSLFHAVLTELIGHGRDSHWRQEGARSESD